MSIFRPLAALLVVSLPSAAQAPPSLIPDLPSAAIEISWSDLKALIEKTIPPPDAPLPVEKPKPPTPWTIASATYDAVAETDASLRIEGHFAITVWEEQEWVSIPVLGDSAAVGEALLNGEPTSLGRLNDGMLTLMLNEPGEHTVDITFYVKTQAQDGIVSFEFPCVPVASTRLTLHVPTADAVVASDLANSVLTSHEDGGVLGRMAFPPTNIIRGHWTLPAKVTEAPKPAEPPRVACTTSTYAAVSDSYTACQSLLRFDVLRGGTDAFRLRVPLEANVLAVEGQGAAWSAEQGDALQYVDVKVNRPIEDHYEITVRYEVPHDENAAAIAIPIVAAEDVTRQSGQIGVSGRGAIELAESPELAGLTRVDVSELAADIRSMAPSPILFAYRYGDDNHVLAIDVHRLEDAPVRVASIDHASILTSITDHGMAITRVEYLVRNNIKQFLRVQVAYGAELWTAEVGGNVVKPARDADTSAVLIPLLKSAEVGPGEGAFTVALTYMEHMAPPKGWRSRLDIQAPAADILVNEVSWNVFIPDGRTLTGSTGDVDPIPVVRRVSSSRPGAERDYTGVETARVYRLREGIERFFITDINNPGASAGGRSDKYKGEPLPPAKSDTTVAGVLPVRATFPVEGTPHGFRGSLVPQDKSLQLSLVTVSTGLVSTGRAATSIVAFVVGLTLALYMVRGKGIRRVVQLTALFVACVLGAWWTLDTVPSFVSYGAIGFAFVLARPLGRHLAARFGPPSATNEAVSGPSGAAS